MPKIKVFPHPEMCPKGQDIDGKVGETLCEAMLDNKIPIEHACELSCACTTCHVVVIEGAKGLSPADELEKSMTDGVFGFGPNSRLSCQLVVGTEPLVIEIPQ